VGPRLLLRAWTPQDVDALAEAVTASLEHLRPWMPWAGNEPLSRSERLDLIERWAREAAAGGDSYFGAFVGDAVVGGCGWHHRIGPAGLELGYWVHVDHTGHGYAGEMVSLLVPAAFDVPAVDRLEIHVDEANEPSARLADRAGFTLVSALPHELTAPGERGIECIWRLTRARWEAGVGPQPISRSPVARPPTTRPSIAGPPEDTVTSW
jgi:ribosomal-protein-serine acetyltransferase